MQIINYSLLSVLVFFIACNAQNKPENASKNTSTTEQATDPATGNTGFEANTATNIGRNVNSIFQDKNDNYWFGTNEGAYRYDGKTLIQFTEKDGLFQNQVLNIQEDKSGNVWFSTGGFGVSRFDGKTFTTFTNRAGLPPGDGLYTEWEIEPDDLWFYAGGGTYRYSGNSFTYLPLPKTDFDSKYSQGPSNRLSTYGVYCTLKDKKGNLWFGTQTMGVCRYDGKSFTWFTEKGLAGPAIRGLFEDKTGNLWFGNNGSGLFRYDGKTLTNFTKENGLGNAEFLKSGKSGPGTLARVWTIAEDYNGNLWIGTADAGVWRYDGSELTNYTTDNGLTSNAVNTVYIDKKGDLWVGTDGAGVCKFNGTSFTRFFIE